MAHVVSLRLAEHQVIVFLKFDADALDKLVGILRHRKKKGDLKTK